MDWLQGQVRGDSTRPSRAEGVQWLCGALPRSRRSATADGPAVRAGAHRHRRGAARPGDRLTPSRTVAAELGVSRVDRDRGVRPARRRGLHRRSRRRRQRRQRDTAAARPPPPVAALEPTPRARPARAVRPIRRPPRAFDFRPGRLDPALFPVAAWRRCTHRTPGPAAQPVRRPGRDARAARRAGELGDPFPRRRGHRGGGVVTSGAGHAIDLVARVLADPGDWWRSRSPAIRRSSTAAQPRSARRRRPGRRPRHRGRRHPGPGPAGVRHAVTPVPARHGDDPPAATRAPALGRRHRRRDHRGRLRQRVPPHRAAARAAAAPRPGRPGDLRRHFQQGLSTGLRAGFLVAPRNLLPALRAVRQVVDWCPPPATQAALSHFINDGLPGPAPAPDPARLRRTAPTHAGGARASSCPSGTGGYPRWRGCTSPSPGPAIPWTPTWSRPSRGTACGCRRCAARTRSTRRAPASCSASPGCRPRSWSRRSAL